VHPGELPAHRRFFSRTAVLVTQRHHQASCGVSSGEETVNLTDDQVRDGETVTRPSLLSGSLGHFTTVTSRRQNGQGDMAADSHAEEPDSARRSAMPNAVPIALVSVLTLAVVLALVWPASAPRPAPAGGDQPDTVTISRSGCGQGWRHPRGGTQELLLD